MIIDDQSFHTSIRALIDEWCERRALCALRHILLRYGAFNGLTDGWAELRLGLRNVRAFCQAELTEAERAQVADLIAVTDRALNGRKSR